MDKLVSVHKKKASKQSKTKKKPVKVVYISNPMKIKTSASEFRALVQELTGQDAEDMPDPSKYSEINGGIIAHDHQMVPDHHHAMKVKDNDDDDDDDDDHLHHHVIPKVDHPGDELLKRSDIPFEPYDDFFTPQMLDNFTGSLGHPALLYESAQVDVHGGLDAI